MLATSFLITLVIGSGSAARADVVTDWNQVMLDAITKAGTGISPIVATRAAAIVQASVYDAVNGIERRYMPIHVEPAAQPGASVRAAAVQAAYASLVRLFPAQQSTFDDKLSDSLFAIASEEAAAHSESIDRGIIWGQIVADEIWAWRTTDGFVPAPPPFTGGLAPGEWRPTPPAFAPGAVPQFAHLVPWSIQSPSQFLPPGPPALSSAQYAADFNEVKLLGRATGSTRTADQTASALFWQSASSPDYFWDRVAARLGALHHTNLSENARLLAMVTIAIADAGIAAWNGKYHYVFWRPITAIQLADTDGNAATIADPTWTPLLTTPPYPEYPSGLLSVSSAAIAVLVSFFGPDTPFIVDSSTPGVTRSFANFPDALTELVNARIWGGIHFRTADVDAATLGTSLGNYIVANAFLSQHGERNGQIRK
jgi:hypothetical protein